MTNRFNIFEGASSSKDEDRLTQLASLQTKMLVFALNNFPNATKLIYSTCSINVEENEQVNFFVTIKFGACHSIRSHIYIYIFHKH